jgi:hypothetical protein
MMIRLPLILLGFVLEASIASAQTPTATPTEVCRAGIASIMGRNPSIMSIRPEADFLWVTYTRPSDKKVWSYRCRVSGNRIEWADGEGIWRDKPHSTLVTFEIVNGGKAIKITEDYRDGSKADKTYPRSKLR